VLLGEAGQGKTHLLVDATRQALEDHRPSVTVFGELLTSKDPLTQIAQQLGLGALSHAALLQAMDAAGSMCQSRFMLIIDALNDSGDPDGWRSALPALIAATAPYDHVAVVVSCRSSLREAVLPDDMTGRGYLVTVHPGFAGHEVEALESYLKAAPSALPRTPMLTPAFSNALFVKLYCESLLSIPEAKRRSAVTPAHRSAVFDAFLDRRAAQINAALALDPAEHLVHRAVAHLGRLMAGEGREVLSRQQAQRAVDALAPQRTSWPRTMLGQLIAHGLVATERHYHPGGGRIATGIGFAYQAFSDDRIIHAVLEEHRAEVEEATAAGVLAADCALRAWLEKASPNLIDAATVLLPEVTGHELIDLLGQGSSPVAGSPGADQQARRRGTLYRALVRTLGLRSTSSVTERTVELLNSSSRERGLGDDVLEAVLTVTTQPGHLLNADRLHRALLRRSPADRDAWWGRETYFALEDTGALHRLLRWAEQLPTPDSARHRSAAPAMLLQRRAGLAAAARPGTQPEPPGEDVVRLAATTLVWTLTSPNRFLRDRASKALVQLLLGYPRVLTGLLQRFLEQDADQIADPYLFERLVLVAHGVLARTRAQQQGHELLEQVARQLLSTVYGPVSGQAHASRNALLCSAATRIITSAYAVGLIDAADLARTQHPHPCADVGDVLGEKDLEERYPYQDADGKPLWSSLWSSLISLADFACYEVRPAVEHFSLLPVSVPLPSDPDAAALIEPAVQAFSDSLPPAVRETLSSPESVRRLLKEHWQAKRVLDDEQYRLLKACMPDPSREQVLAFSGVDKDWACRWIMDNAVQRGWTPQRFADFDRHHGHGRGDRQGHKAERMGKKYAWLGLHELIERLANQRHMKQGPRPEFATYPGAGPLRLTDLDPTLPPAAHPLSDLADDDGTTDDIRYATFAASDLDGQWNPPAPALPSADRIGEWIEGTDQLPDLTELGIRSLDGAAWVVLNEYASDHAPGREWSGEAEQWHIQHSWLVADAYYPEVLQFLRDRNLMGRWMPEFPSRHGLYLDDLPLPYDPAQDGRHELRIVNHDSTDQPLPAEPAAPPAEGDDTAAQGAAPPAQGTAQPAQDSDIAEWLDLTIGYRGSRRKPPDREEELHRLAARWAKPSPAPAGDAEAPSPHLAYAQDGTVLRAHPAVEEYNWSGSGHDCSLDAPVSLIMPCAQLLTSSGLQRDPDNGQWYNPDGILVVRAAHGHRPTGSVTTLLVRRDWLEQRLTPIGMRLVLGLFGERQPRSADHLRQWREFSQTAGLEPGKPLTAAPRITEVHHTGDD